MWVRNPRGPSQTQRVNGEKNLLSRPVTFRAALWVNKEGNSESIKPLYTTQTGNYCHCLIPTISPY